MITEKPWENEYCPTCIHNFDVDMCNLKIPGFDNLYCPQVKNCYQYKNRFIPPYMDYDITRKDKE